MKSSTRRSREWPHARIREWQASVIGFLVAVGIAMFIVDFSRFIWHLIVG